MSKISTDSLSLSLYLSLCLSLFCAKSIFQSYVHTFYLKCDTESREAASYTMCSQSKLQNLKR